MRADGLIKAYGHKSVFDGFSCGFENNAVNWIMGESGCGKTTLLRIIAGLEEYEGNISDIPQGGISFVFQEDRLFESLSPLENCALVNRNADAVGILLSMGLSDDDIRKPVRELSGGMKRRTAVARALCADFGLLLLDEPFKGIDNENRIRTAEAVKAAAAGKTIIAVTHDITDTGLLSGNIIKLS